MRRLLSPALLVAALHVPLCCVSPSAAQLFTVSGQPIPGTEDVSLAPGMQLQDLDLTRLRLVHGRDLSQSDFSGSQLRGAQLASTLTRADFRAADLTASRLDGVFFGADFRDAKLDLAELRGSFASANFAHQDLSGAHLSGDFTGADFTNAVLPRFVRGQSSFSFANLRGADLTGGNRQSRFGRASFVGADLREADLTFVRFDGADFTGADLRGATLKETRFRGGRMHLADLRQTDLSEVVEISAPIGARYDQFTIFREGRRGPNRAWMHYDPATRGDANLDEVVDFEDLLTVLSAFGSTCEEAKLACWKRGDFGADGLVGFDDFLQVAARLQTAADVRSVPEPGGAGLFLLGAALALRLGIPQRARGYDRSMAVV